MESDGVDLAVRQLTHAGGDPPWTDPGSHVCTYVRRMYCMYVTYVHTYILTVLYGVEYGVQMQYAPKLRGRLPKPALPCESTFYRRIRLGRHGKSHVSHLNLRQNWTSSGLRLNLEAGVILVDIFLRVDFRRTRLATGAVARRPPRETPPPRSGPHKPWWRRQK